MIGRMRNVRHLKVASREIYTGVVSLRDIDVNITYDCMMDNIILHEGLLLTPQEIDAIRLYSRGFFEGLLSTAEKSAS